MSWFDMSSDDDERLRNLLVFHVWATDKEFEDMAPIFVIIFALCVVGGLIYYFVK